MIVPILALAFLFIAFIFFWQSGRQRKAAGLPGGRIIYTDTRGWGKVEKPLFYAALDLAGKYRDILGAENFFLEMHDHGIEAHDVRARAGLHRRTSSAS